MHALRSEHVHLPQDIGHIHETHFQATLLPQLLKCAPASGVYLHCAYMFGQIKMEIPWYINRHTLISRSKKNTTLHTRIQPHTTCTHTYTQYYKHAYTHMRACGACAHTSSL